MKNEDWAINMNPTGVVFEWLTARLSEFPAVGADHLSPETRFDELGLDSISRAGLARDLSRHFGVALDPDVMYEYSTVGQFAAYVGARVRND